MIIKIVTFFLIGIGVLAMFGKLRVPGVDRIRKIGQTKPRKCRKCGRYILTKSPCECEQKRG